MKKVIKTYPGLCKDCGGLGQFMDSRTAPVCKTCPVCKGTGVITITETYEPLYSIEVDPSFKTTPIQIIRDRLHLDDESGHMVPTLFKARRKMNYLTLRYIAAKTGISPATILRIENGKKCLADNYNALLKFWKEYGTHTDK